MNKFFSWVLHLFFPTRCIICKTQGPDICKRCLQAFESAKPSNHPWITSFWNYRDFHVEQIMRYLKNYPNARLVAYLVTSIHTPASIHSDAIIIPVPIHKNRFMDRGYNQAELIAQAFSKKLHLPLVNHVVYKKISTHKQGTLKSRQSRIHNLENSFGVRTPSAIRGKHCIIVDDITTTGSTLCEIQKTLLASGAQSVSALTLAN